MILRTVVVQVDLARPKKHSLSRKGSPECRRWFHKPGMGKESFGAEFDVFVGQVFATAEVASGSMSGAPQRPLLFCLTASVCHQLQAVLSLAVEGRNPVKS